MKSTMISVLLVFFVAFIDISAKDSAEIKRKRNEFACDMKCQIVTAEFKSDGKDFTREKYEKLHQEILKVLNWKETKTVETTAEVELTTTGKSTKTIEPTTTAQLTNTVELTTTEAANTEEPTTRTEATTTADPTTKEPETTMTSTDRSVTPERCRAIRADCVRRRRRKRRSSAVERIVYEDRDLFFVDLESDQIKEDVIRIPIVLHKKENTIPEDRLYDVLVNMDENGKLGLYAGSIVVNIYRGFPRSALEVDHRVWIPIVITAGLLLLLLLLGTIFYFVFIATPRHNREQVSSRSNHTTDKKMLADEGPCVELTSSHNGHCHPLQQNGVIIPIMMDDNWGWLVPITEVESKTSLIV